MSSLIKFWLTYRRCGAPVCCASFGSQPVPTADAVAIPAPCDKETSRLTNPFSCASCWARPVSSTPTQPPGMRTISISRHSGAMVRGRSALSTASFAQKRAASPGASRCGTASYPPQLSTSCAVKIRSRYRRPCRSMDSATLSIDWTSVPTRRTNLPPSVGSSGIGAVCVPAAISGGCRARGCRVRSRARRLLGSRGGGPAWPEPWCWSCRSTQASPLFES